MFASLFSDHPSLVQFHRDLIDSTREAKKVRDGITHSLPVESAQPRRSIIFLDRTIKRRTEKVYTKEMLIDLNNVLSEAAGWLEALGTVEQTVLRATSHERDALLKVFGKDRWLKATLSELKTPPQSSPQ